MWDLRERGSLTAMSDEVDDELLSVCVIKVRVVARLLCNPSKLLTNCSTIGR